MGSWYMHTFSTCPTDVGNNREEKVHSLIICSAAGRTYIPYIVMNGDICDDAPNVKKRTPLFGQTHNERADLCAIFAAYLLVAKYIYGMDIRSPLPPAPAKNIVQHESRILKNTEYNCFRAYVTPC